MKRSISSAEIRTSGAPNLANDDGELFYLPDFLSNGQAEVYFRELRDALSWRAESIVIAGRHVDVPRLVCWYGDPQAVYRYSGVTHLPEPWITPLLELRRLLELNCGALFNSVLGNYYRDGRDSMGWHADREKSLGRDPVIASISLGAARLFKLQHERSKRRIDLELGNGSLLLMAGSLQHHWRHCLPKSPKIDRPRINLTFRRIIVPDS